MKRIILFFIAVSISMNVFARSWWATTIVDAAGAWGGATGGAPYFPPWGAIAGGVLCGAGASLALVTNSGSKPNNQWKEVPNKMNAFDSAGIKHNKLMSDYLTANREFNLKTYVPFVQTHYAKYGFKKEWLPSAGQIEKEINNTRSVKLETIEDAIKFLSPRLPKGEDPKKFETVIKTLLSTKDVSMFNAIVNNVENQYLQTVSSANKLTMSVFFSVLRYSANYWN